MVLPTLYKKTNTGAVQFWTIYAYEDSDHSSAYIIQTEYGQVGTDSPQTTFDTVYEGKNVGKANETSIREQAEAEAKAKHDKQKKKGYVESIEGAQKGELDELIEGGIVPMLAHTFEKQGKKIKYPCLVQPKLDGIRCIAILQDGVCTLWSRTRKPINSCPHIVDEIEKHFKADIVLDGELYNHDLKKDFEKIVSAVRKEGPEDGYLNVQYHIYDTVNEDTFEERNRKLFKAFTIGNPKLTYLGLAETLLVENEDQVSDFYARFMEQGYEGCMLRNLSSLYVNKRSADLIKVKEMQDAEFEIIGIEEGRGKLSGHVGAFVCRTEDGQEFKAKMSGNTERLKEYFENHKLWKNRVLTVQYQDLTSYGLPRFPVGLRIRENE